MSFREYLQEKRIGETQIVLTYKKDPSLKISYDLAKAIYNYDYKIAGLETDGRPNYPDANKIKTNKLDNDNKKWIMAILKDTWLKTYGDDVNLYGEPYSTFYGEYTSLEGDISLVKDKMSVDKNFKIELE